MPGIIDKVTKPFINASVFAWDFGLFILVPKGAPGHNLTWPKYVPPKHGDSRSACPMLNAMANHGILPHDGKNITFKELKTKVRETFNFAPSFCFFVPKFSADFLNR
jgi:hypothetical protein